MHHRTKLIAFLVWPLIAVAISFATHAHAFVSQILFLGVPSLMLALLAPRYVLKVTVFTIVFVPLWLFVEYVMNSTGQWYAISVFHSRFLGNIAYDAITWFFLAQFYIIMFWEYFFESHHCVKIWRPRMTPLALTLFAFLLATAGLWLWAPYILKIPYFYLVLTLAAFVLPLVLELRAHPKLLHRFLKVGAYFTYVFILYELTGVALEQWYFPSTKFIGWVQLFGWRFPFEEFISWILIGSMTCLAWYEHFDDDER
mgnify:CR=1 FL=1